MNIEDIKRKLLVKYPFFGSVVANSNFIAEPSIGTAGTDGKNIYYNPQFIESINDNQKTFVFAHEICHIAFEHITRSEGKDKELWNIATDSVVNAFLKQDGLPMVEGGVDIPEAINYDSEDMYNKLLEEKQKNEQQNEQNNDSENQNRQESSNSKSENSDNQNDQSDSKSSSNSEQSEGGKNETHDVGHDTHSMWEEAIEKKQEEEHSSNNKDEHKQSLANKLNKMFGQKNEQSKEEQEIQQPDEKQKNDQEKEKNEAIKKLTELGEKKAFKQNKIERKKQLEELRKSLASQSHGHGSETNSDRRNIDNIGRSDPLIDWRKALKETVKYDIDWSYQNAGIEDGVVTAYLEEMPRPETEIVLDTSGSIDENLLRNFLRECKNILQTSKVKVGCFDTRFYGFTEIKNISDIDRLPFYGGGGTDFDAAVNAFTKRVDNKIIFTDGYANMPRTPIDAIWIVFGERKIHPAGGKVIYINGEQLERLYNYQMTDDNKGKSR